MRTVPRTVPCTILPFARVRFGVLSRPYTLPEMNEQPAKDHPDRHMAASAQAEVAHLQQAVQAWIDSDRVLPADGSALLAMLARVQEELANGNAPAARPGITTFVGQVQALIDTGLLATGDGQPLIEVAARVAASLRIAGGIDR